MRSRDSSAITPNSIAASRHSDHRSSTSARYSAPWPFPTDDERARPPMSKRHPVVAITGSSGAGTTTVTRTFEHIFRREGFTAAIVEGDSFHRYDRKEMKAKMAEAGEVGNAHFSHFGPEAN